MAYQTIIYEKADSVATITLNRPQFFNALDLAICAELQDALGRCSRDEDVRAVVLTGNGRAFCAGGDVREMQETLKSPDTDSTLVFLRKLAADLHLVISEIRRLNKPVIAAVNGVAAGAGFPLALCCDIIVAAESARFNMAYINIGLSPDGGSSFFLPRAVGMHRASYLFFTGDFLDARAGHEAGFVNQVVPDDELMAAARALATRLAAAPTQAIARGKALINRSVGDFMETQMEMERAAISAGCETEDFREGITAFFEKRKPVFKGK